MALFSLGRWSWLLAIGLLLVLLPGGADAFGAGNIPSVAQVEGHNWRHGDIEDMLTTIAFAHGKKWSSMLIKRTYFGNWLRDYSQAIDVGSLKGPVNGNTIRILIWVLSFMAFGYATEEFEVTEERLGVYRPEEHIDNPLGYADGMDASKIHPRLRGPVLPVETEIDGRTGMKNYIANEHGNWATSAGYLRFSISNCIHYGRKHFCGGHSAEKDHDLNEALRYLGQALHCLEDFSAHSNYCELALREMGHGNIFPHCGEQTQLNLNGRHVFPLVTGTFGAVDFLHSVIGEATDHFTQSEVDEVDLVLKDAEKGGSGGSGTSTSGTRGFGLPKADGFISLIAKLPGVGGGFASEAKRLKETSEAQERQNQMATSNTRDMSRASANPVPGMGPEFDAVKVSKQIYPILEYRDKIVKAISAGISKVPGLEKLLEHIGESLTSFILGLLAPFVRPIIQQVSKVLKEGSSSIINASAKAQMEPWTNSRCSDPTHSMLSKDHFTNILNSCAGRVATAVLQYAVPRIIHVWERPHVPVEQVVGDILQVLHHPAMRNHSKESLQGQMYSTVQKWFEEHPRRNEVPHLLTSESVKNGKNHLLNGHKGHGGPGEHHHGSPWAELGGHGKTTGGLWGQIKTRDLSAMQGGDGNPATNYLSASPLGSPAYPPANTNYGYTGVDGHLRPSSSGYSAPSPQPYQTTFQPPAHAPPPSGQGYYPPQPQYQQQQPQYQQQQPQYQPQQPQYQQQQPQYQQHQQPSSQSQFPGQGYGPGHHHQQPSPQPPQGYPPQQGYYQGQPPPPQGGYPPYQQY